MSDVTGTTERTFGPTKKMKNTYVVKLDNLPIRAELFEMQQKTPLAVINRNGVATQADGGFITHFPNPGAYDMVAAYRYLHPYMGKNATTIIEYLGRNGEPVALMFPTCVYIFDEYEQDYMTRMNHATRRDFYYQAAMRDKQITEYYKSKGK